jgi:choice-of-anchor B domain-containing protein
MNYLKSLAFTPLLLLLLNFKAQNNPLNVEQVAHVPLSSFQVPSDLNDIWGWVDNEGNEYAIVGTRQGTSVFDLSTPSEPVEVFFEQGLNSIWRDVKTYGDFAYITTEAQNGLLIIDLSPLPLSNDLTTYYYNYSSSADWNKAHNIFIDDRGYAYIFGANRGNGGCIILDLNLDPTQPVEIADINNWYAHDGMVHGDTLFLANGSDSFFSIWDVSTPSNPVLLAQNPTVGFYSHNIWSSDDGNYVYTTEEDNGGHLSEFDISNFNNIELTDKIQAEPGNNIMPHNAFFINDYIINSYYTTGIQLFDVKNKGNLINVGHFDTSPNYAGPGSDGCWGVYPWLPSGLIIASDIQEGLYVLSPTYKRGAYLEGEVKDAATNQTINGVNIEIININESATSNSQGEFKMGTVNSGSFDLVFSHQFYQSDTLYNVILQNDSITNINKLMYQMDPISFNIETNKSSDNSTLGNVNFSLESDNFYFSGVTSSNGSFVVNDLIPGSYRFYAALWGYKEFCDEQLSITNSSSSLVINLDEGYSDRFNLDLNWEVNSSSLSGKWVRESPILTTYNNANCNAGEDSFDCGEKAYVTGNAGGNATADDVDLGFTELVSPSMSLPNNEDYYLHCSIWWKNLGDNNPDDSLHIFINDGVNELVLFSANSSNDFEWRDTVLLLPNSIDLSNFNIKLITADLTSGNDHLVEAGFDNFLISNSPTSNQNDYSELDNIFIYPNPTANGYLNIEGFTKTMNYELYSISGVLVQKGSSPNFKINNKGVYLLKINLEDRSVIRKIIY